MPDLHPQLPSRNRLLAAMPEADAAALAPHLERVPLELRMPIERPGEPIAHVYFPLAGMGSVVAVGDRRRDQRVEAGIFGPEGVSGVPRILGADRSPHECFVQMPGEALRLPADALRAAMDERPGVRRVLLLYAQAWTTQVAHTALAQARAKLEERLARWLVMSHDRAGGCELALTHEFLSLMLGVRRAGVTVATHLLEERGLIQARRGAVAIIDREGLVEAADGAYGVPEAEYERLLGPLAPSAG